MLSALDGDLANAGSKACKAEGRSYHQFMPPPPQLVTKSFNVGGPRKAYALVATKGLRLDPTLGFCRLDSRLVLFDDDDEDTLGFCRRYSRLVHI